MEKGKRTNFFELAVGSCIFETLLTAHGTLFSITVTQLRRNALIFFIYKEESLFVCLFVMHLNKVRASAAKLSRNPTLIQEKVQSYFSPETYKFSPH